MKKKIRELKWGELFKLKDTESAPVWVRSEYNHQDKKYSTYRYDDVCRERFMRGDAEVFVDFEF